MQARLVVCVLVAGATASMPMVVSAAVAPAYALIPYTFEEPAASVVEAARAEKCADVVTAWEKYEEEVPPGVRDVRVQFLAGRCFHRRGNHDRAIDLLRTLPLAYPALAGEIGHMLGKSLIATRRYEEAVEVLGEVRPPSHRHAASRILAARAALLGGDPYTTLTVLADAERTMNREWEKANALAAIAEAEDRLRNRTRARSLKHRIWSKYPTTDEADAIWADISTGRLSWPGAETYIERLEGLIAAGHITSAKALVAAFGARGGTFGSGAKPDPNVAWRDYGLGEIALSDRDYDGARALFEGALAVAETSRLKARLRCRVGKSIARKGELDEAKDAYESSLKPWPRGHFAARCWHDYGMLLAYHREYDEARSAFMNAAARSADDMNLPLRAESLWRVAWLTYRTGHPGEALKRFETIAHESWPIPPELREHDEWQSHKLGFLSVERASYWQARALADLGRTDEAIERYEWLARTFPLRYYGELAIQRLDELDPARALAIRDRSAARVATAIETDPVAAGHVDLSMVPVPRSGGIAPGVEWIRLGNREEAKKVLRGAFLNDWLSDDGLVLLSTLYLEDDERHWRSHWVLKWRGRFRHYPYASYDEEIDAVLDARTAGGELADTADTVALRTSDLAWWLCFPRSHAEHVEAVADELGVEPALIYAVMRNESGFRVKVVSVAGALGLMQVLFKTAAFTATKLLKLKGVTKAKVFEPPVNVRIGARYLKELLHLFKGNVMLAAAGYNAGPYNATSWWKRRADLETDMFVEEIPVEQTYGYTRKVFASYATYRYLYGEVTTTDSKPTSTYPGRVPATLGTWMGKVIARRADIEHPKHPAGPRKPSKTTAGP